MKMFLNMIFIHTSKNHKNYKNPINKNNLLTFVYFIIFKIHEICYSFKENLMHLN